ncbi:MAG TPA: hypothetical protein VLM85_25095 [Polyangiaceae bacterium]|nr:hypothetical protein [Polyangiaceae bacterium]
MRRSVRWVLGVSVLVVTSWMTWDNVLSDEDPIKALAEKAACTLKKCEEQHGITRMERTPIGQSFSYTWRDGTVSVDCHREYYVVGTRSCTAH